MHENRPGFRLVAGRVVLFCVVALTGFTIVTVEGSTNSPAANPIESPTALTVSGPATPFITPAQPIGKRGKALLTWREGSNSFGSFVYYGTNSGVYTGLLDAGTATTLTIGDLDEGTKYYFLVRCYGSDRAPGPPSAEVSVTTSIFISMAYDRWKIQAYGIPGKTNRMQVSTNLTDWSTMLTWIGNGQQTNALHTNTALSWFRVEAN